MPKLPSPPSKRWASRLGRARQARRQLQLILDECEADLEQDPTMEDREVAGCARMGLMATDGMVDKIKVFDEAEKANGKKAATDAPGEGEA